MYKTGVVKYNIPDGNNVESTSISSFAGLHLIDNPLLAKENSAADMNNVYLSMENTLTTRPRLEYTGLLVCDKLISQIELAEDDILYHYVLNNEIHLRHSGIEIELTDIDIGLDKISAFKKDDKIYVLSKNGYFVIKSDNKIYNVVNDVDTYVPTTKISTLGVETAFEKKNILTNKYKIKSDWNGSDSLRELYKDADSLDENGYIKQITSRLEIGDIAVAGTIIPNLKCKSKNGDFIFTYPITSNKPVYLYKTASNEFYNLTDKYNFSSSLRCIISDDGNWVGQIKTGWSGVVAYNLKNDDSFDFDMKEEEGYSFSAVGITNLSDVWAIKSSTVSNSYKIVYYKKYTDEDEVSTTKHIETSLIEYGGSVLGIPRSYRLLIDNARNIAYVWESNRNKIRKCSVNNDAIVMEDLFFSDTPSNSINSNAILSNDGESILTYNAENQFTINYLNGEPAKTYDSSSIITSVSSSFNGEYVYAIAGNSLIEVNILNDSEGIIKSFDVSPTAISGSSILGFSLFPKEEYQRYDMLISIYSYESSIELLLSYVYGNKELSENIAFINYKQFYNNYWFVFGNILYNTTNNDPTYIADGSKSVIGDDLDITGMTLLTDSAMVVYKPNKQFVIYASETEGEVYYYKNEMKSNEGNLPKFQTLTTSINQYPLQFNNNGIFVLSIPENINTDTNTATSISSKINLKYLAEPDKENIITHNHLYWTYVIFPRKNKSSIYVLDNRTNEWYYWEVPIKILGCREIKRIYDVVKDSSGETIRICNDAEDWSFSITELLPDGTPGYVTNYSKDNRSDYEQRQYVETEFITEDGIKYEFKTIDHFDSETEIGTEYLDLICTEANGTKAVVEAVTIPWKWESQIMPLTYTKYSKGYPAIGYTKQLQQTGFIFVDSDKTEEYALDYQFTVYGKHMTDKTPKSLPMGTLNYIRSVLKRTRIPKFNFIKITLSNHEDNNNKLNLISLKFKYRLMQEVV